MSLVLADQIWMARSKSARVARVGTTVTQCDPCQPGVRGDIRNQRRGLLGGARRYALREGWLAVIRADV
eukprot:2024880-Pleurochrysis_carterae.AAC.1